jgi:hypothetical protein
MKKLVEFKLDNICAATRCDRLDIVIAGMDSLSVVKDFNIVKHGFSSVFSG